MQVKLNRITIFSFFLSMSIGACNCNPAEETYSVKTTSPSSSGDASGQSNPAQTTLPPNHNPSTNSTTNPPTNSTTNPPTNSTTNPPTNSTTNPPTNPTTNSTTNPTTNSPLGSTQNPPSVVNNSNPAASSSAMPITDDMIQTLRKPRGFQSLDIFRTAFADRLEEIKNGTVQIGGDNDWYEFDGKKRNLITAAIYTQSSDVLKALVELGVSVKNITPNNENALNVACGLGNLEAVKFLFTIEELKSKALDKSGSYKNTNLMLAVKSKNMSVVKYVWEETKKLPGGSAFLSIDSQADITGTTPVQQARKDKQPVIEIFLLSKGFK